MTSSKFGWSAALFFVAATTFAACSGTQSVPVGGFPPGGGSPIPTPSGAATPTPTPGGGGATPTPTPVGTATPTLAPTSTPTPTATPTSVACANGVGRVDPGTGGIRLTGPAQTVNVPCFLDRPGNNVTITAAVPPNDGATYPGGNPVTITSSTDRSPIAFTPTGVTGIIIGYVGLTPTNTVVFACNNPGQPPCGTGTNPGGLYIQSNVTNVDFILAGHTYAYQVYAVIPGVPPINIQGPGSTLGPTDTPIVQSPDGHTISFGITPGISGSFNGGSTGLVVLYDTTPGAMCPACH